MTFGGRRGLGIRKERSYERSFRDVLICCTEKLQLDAGGRDAVVANSFATDGIAGLDAGKQGPFDGALDDYLARVCGNGGKQQLFLVGAR